MEGGETVEVLSLCRIGRSRAQCIYVYLIMYIHTHGGRLVAQMVKNLPAVQEARVQSLGQEGPLEKGMATHSSILAWRLPWTEEPGGQRKIVGQTHSIT